MKKIITLTAVSLMIVPAMSADGKISEANTASAVSKDYVQTSDRIKDAYERMANAYAYSQPLKLNDFPSGTVNVPTRLVYGMMHFSLDKTPLALTFGRGSIFFDGDSIPVPTVSAKLVKNGSAIVTGEMGGQAESGGFIFKYRDILSLSLRRNGKSGKVYGKLTFANPSANADVHYFILP